MKAAGKFKQLNTNIDARLMDQLDRLKAKTKVSKKALLEQAIRLLLTRYQSFGKVYKGGMVDEQFMILADSAMDEYDQTMKKLAE